MKYILFESLVIIITSVGLGLASPVPSAPSEFNHFSESYLEAPKGLSSELLRYTSLESKDDFLITSLTEDFLMIKGLGV